MRISHSKDDWLIVQALKDILGEQIRGREAKEDVSTFNDFLKLGVLNNRWIGKFSLHVIHANCSAWPNDAAFIEQENIRLRCTGTNEQVNHSDTSTSRAINHDLNFTNFLLLNLESIIKTSETNDRNAVTTVVEHWYVHFLTEFLFYLETIGRLETLKEDTTERRTQGLDNFEDFFFFWRVNADVDAIDTREFFNKH